MTSEFVFDVTADNFQMEVAERSMKTPVLLDFWADWCGPCKTLGPLLEKLAAGYGGSFVLGKVDTEREPDLAYAFQVQGIPFCVLVDHGRPLDAFQGALPETEVKRFLQRHAIGPAAPVKPQPAEPAVIDPGSPEGRLLAARLAAATGKPAEARAALAGFPEDHEKIDQARRLEAGLEFLEAQLKPTAAGAEGELARSRQALGSGDHEGAMEHALAAVAAEKGFRGGLPRKAMLLCFQLMGEDDERVDSFRRRLATLLY